MSVYVSVYVSDVIQPRCDGSEGRRDLTGVSLMGCVRPSGAGRGGAGRALCGAGRALRGHNGAS